MVYINTPYGFMARPTTSEGAWAFFSDNAAMPTIHIQISSIFLSLYLIYNKFEAKGIYVRNV